VVLMCAGASMDQLMREANDLVVQTRSMTAVDEAAGKFVTDEFRFGATGKVYHTTYFIRPETVNALARWLRLEAPHAQAAADVQKRTSRVAHADIPALVDTDVSLFDATDPSGHVLTAIQTFAPSYGVIRRQESGHLSHYAFKEDELLAQLKGGDPERPLGEALNLSEVAESPVQTVGTAARVAGNPEATTARRAVVMVGDLPVGVVPAPSDFVAHEELPGLAYAIGGWGGASPSSGTVRRIMPTFGTGRSVRGPQRSRLMYTDSRPGGDVAIVLKPAGATTVDRPMSEPEPAAPTARHIDISAPAPAESAVRAIDASAPAPAAPAPETKVGLHFLAEMPGEVKVSASSTVVVTVSREALQAAAAAASAMGTGDAVAARKLLIQVIPRAQFDIDQDRYTVDIPEPGKLQSLFFDLTATHEGDGEIWVVIRQDQAPICTLVLQPKVVAATSGTQRRLHAESEAGDAPFLGAPLHELRIMDVRNGDEVRYRFELYSPSLRLLKEFKSEDMKEDVQSFVNRLYKDIEQRWLSTKGDQADFAAEMRAIGAELFSKLFPLELRQILWEHRNEITSILAISTEPFIPWEVVLVKDPAAKGMGDSRYLAEMGLVRWLYEADWPPYELRIRQGRARYVIPKYPLKEFVLPGALEEATGLQQFFGAVSVTPQPSPVRDLLSEKSFDLLHFACHAGAEGEDVSKGRILLEGRLESVGNEMKYVPATIDATVVGEYADMKEADGTRPVVVLNACQAGRGGYRLSSTGGFAQSFLKGGAGAFIGALWSVGDQPARTFTEEFYRQLLNKETVAKAATLARDKAKSAGDATWLAYVVYAHPNAVLSTS
ncbi:MAG: CHAT domain-containing protein, partial [Bryobacteraceae bacterium]